MTAINIGFIGCLMVYLVTAVDHVDIDLSVDRTGWKDPLDPFSSYHEEQNNAEKLAICEKTLKNCQKNHGSSLKTLDDDVKGSDPTLKLIIRNMLSRLNIDIEQVNHVDRTASVYLNENDLKTLRRYLNSKRDSVSLREQVRMVLEGFITQQDMYSEPSWYTRFGSTVIPFLPILNVLLVVPSVLVLLSRTHSTKSLVVLIMFTAFLVSLYTVYNNKYQKNIAARMAVSEVPEACAPKSLWWNAWQMIKSSMVIGGKSECEQYYESLVVDPLYEISPMEVLADVLSNFIFTPISVFGRHSNTFFKEFFREDPIWLVALKTALLPIILVCIMFWASGYRIRTIFATLEPAGVPYTPYDWALSAPAQSQAIQEQRTTEGQSNHRAIENIAKTIPTPVKSNSDRSRFDSDIRQRTNNKKRSHSLGRLAL